MKTTPKGKPLGPLLQQETSVRRMTESGQIFGETFLQPYGHLRTSGERPYCTQIAVKQQQRSQFSRLMKLLPFQESSKNSNLETSLTSIDSLIKSETFKRNT